MKHFASTLQRFWDWRAAGNFIFGGTGGSLMLLLALHAASQPMPATLLAALSSTLAPQPAMLLPVALIGAGLGCVWLEIGRPWRALNVYRHSQTSWMTREAIVALFALALGVAAAATALWSVSLAAGAAGLGFVYCQARILRAARGIPAWREASIVPLILLTGLTEGMGLLLALSVISGVPLRWYPLGLLALIAARGAAALRYRRSLHTAPAAALAQIDRQRALVIGIGHVMPAFFGVLALIPLPAPWPGMAAVLAGLSALAGGWWLKFVIVARAAHVQGYAFGKLRRGHPLNLPTPATR